MDEFLEYLYVTGQLDDKNEDDKDNDNEKEDEDDKEKGYPLTYKRKW